MNILMHFQKNSISNYSIQRKEPKSKPEKKILREKQKKIYSGCENTENREKMPYSQSHFWLSWVNAEGNTHSKHLPFLFHLCFFFLFSLFLGSNFSLFFSSSLLSKIAFKTFSQIQDYFWEIKKHWKKERRKL